MKTFTNNTDVSFRQLFKKDGWFSRLIFIQLIVCPIHISILRILRPIKNPSDWFWPIFLIAGHLMIGFLLWKKRTRFTITASTFLLWLLFVLRRVSSLFAAVVLLVAALHSEEASNSQMNYRIFVPVYAIVLAVIALALTVIWARNLGRLKRDCV